jgi:NAD(P)-dependent dehydrogenase (short-subunit alcohol dehydrogenase family)
VTAAENRVAFVTGAASGIGHHASLRLEADGFRVVGADLDPGGLAQLCDEGQTISSVVCDVTSPEAVNVAVEGVVAEFGRLDAVLNSAGITGPSVPTWELSHEDWMRIVAVNLTGTLNVIKAALWPMRSAGYGRIVNMASIAGKEGNPNLMAYSATKAGVIGMTKSVAKEVATEGVLVNSIAPAVIRTPINDGVDPETQAYMLSKIPMGRLGEVEEVSELISFLASDRCTFSTGACFDLSGGRATY